MNERKLWNGKILSVLNMNISFADSNATEKPFVPFDTATHHYLN